MKDYSYFYELEKIAADIKHHPAKSPLEKFLSKEQFVKFYYQHNMALTEIGYELGVQVNRLRRLKKKYGIETNVVATKKAIDKHVTGFTLRTFRDLLSKQELYQKYVVEKKSMGDIAKEYDVSRTAVHKYLKEAGLL